VITCNTWSGYCHNVIILRTNSVPSADPHKHSCSARGPNVPQHTQLTTTLFTFKMSYSLTAHGLPRAHTDEAQHCVKVVYTEFHPNRSRKTESAAVNSLMLLSKYHCHSADCHSRQPFIKNSYTRSRETYMKNSVAENTSQTDWRRLPTRSSPLLQTEWPTMPSTVYNYRQTQSAPLLCANYRSNQHPLDHTRQQH